jgi:hypothetical protein
MPVTSTPALGVDDLVDTLYGSGPSQSGNLEAEVVAGRWIATGSTAINATRGTCDRSGLA